MLPPVYLLVRSLGGGSELWDLLFRAKVAAILGRTMLLVVAVTAGSVALALPLAWLTARTDLPLRKMWAVLVSLPLVIPSYVAGFVVVVALGPRGMLQGALEGPFSVERLPSIYGFAGAMLTLTFLSYPYVLLTVRAALQRIDPGFGGVGTRLGVGAGSHVLPSGCAAVASGSRSRSTAGGTVYAQRLRGGFRCCVTRLSPGPYFRSTSPPSTAHWALGFRWRSWRLPLPGWRWSSSAAGAAATTPPPRAPPGPPRRCDWENGAGPRLRFALR